MLKRLVGSTCAVVLAAGTLIAVSATEVPALNNFVHGNLTCSATGTARYTPPLRDGTPQTTKAVIKGTLSCGLGETGIDNTHVTGGTFKAISNYFGGDCAHTWGGTSPELTMKIKWNSDSAQKIRNTDVSWGTPVSSAVDPYYSLEYAGGDVTALGVAGSYFGATAGVSFVSTSMGNAASCAGRLRSGWTFGGADSKLTFQSPPYVSAVTPGSSTLGQTLDVDITGQDFSADDTVGFSGDGITINNSAYVSPNELTANITVAPDALAGMRDITVSNSTLGVGTCTDCFMVAPTVTSVSPTSLGRGATNRNVTITGVGFAPGAVTQFGDAGSGVTVNYTAYVSPTQLTANVNVASTAPLTPIDVTVTDPGNGVGTCTACFSVNVGPTVTNVNPAARGIGATGQVISITGTNFVSGATVAFGNPGIVVASQNFVSPTQVTATINIPAGTAMGVGSVRVTNPDGGSGACLTCFTVNKGPTVTDWQVLPGWQYHYKIRRHGVSFESRYAFSANIQIIGTNFASGATVAYTSDDVDINSTTFVSSTKIKQSVDIDVNDYYLNGLPIDRAVIVTNPDGGSFTCPGAVVLLV